MGCDRPPPVSDAGRGFLARLAFLGTPGVAATTLEALLEAGHQIALVVTQPDKRRGRGGATAPSPVKRAAIAAGLPVSHAAADLLGMGAELGVVVAFGRIIAPEVLAGLAMVNLHFSLLPRWRGAAPVERAILAGDEETGVCLMAVVDELDAGGVYMSRRVRIGEEETAAELTHHLGAVGNELLLDALEDLPASLGEAVPQIGEPTWAEKIDSALLQLDWHAPAFELARVVRLGRAWSTVGGRRVTVWRARSVPAVTGLAPGQIEGNVVATGAGSLELLEVQPEGRRRMPAADWLRGLPGTVQRSFEHSVD